MLGARSALWRASSSDPLDGHFSMNYARKAPFVGQALRASPCELAAGDPILRMPSPKERVVRAVASNVLIRAVSAGALRAATLFLPFADPAFAGGEGNKKNAMECAIVCLRGALRLAFFEKLMPWFDAEARNSKGQTLLLFAADFASVESVRFLIPRSDAKAADSRGRTALIMVAGRPVAGPECLRMLLPHSDPCAADHLGNTALHEAALVSDENVAILLPFSNPHAQNRDGLTPLMASLRQRNESSFLLLPVSDARIRDKDGKTALDYALRRTSMPGVNEEMAQLIRKRMAQNDQEDLSAAVAPADQPPDTDRRRPKSL